MAKAEVVTSTMARILVKDLKVTIRVIEVSTTTTRLKTPVVIPTKDRTWIEMAQDMEIGITHFTIDAIKGTTTIIISLNSREISLARTDMASLIKGSKTRRMNRIVRALETSNQVKIATGAVNSTTNKIEGTRQETDLKTTIKDLTRGSKGREAEKEATIVLNLISRTIMLIGDKITDMITATSSIGHLTRIASVTSMTRDSQISMTTAIRIDRTASIRGSTTITIIKTVITKEISISHKLFITKHRMRRRSKWWLGLLQAGLLLKLS